MMKTFNEYIQGVNANPNAQNTQQNSEVSQIENDIKNMPTKRFTEVMATLNRVAQLTGDQKLLNYATIMNSLPQNMTNSLNEYKAKQNQKQMANNKPNNLNQNTATSFAQTFNQ